MPIESLFPTRVYTARLQGRGGGSLRSRLLRECRQLRLDDRAGRRWSAVNYPGGYTSYGTANRMHTLSPTFAELQQRLARHVNAFTAALELDVAHRALSMTDCWVNIVPRGVAHGLHLHPLSTLSGTFYVQAPGGCPGLKFEDPRLDRMMAAPPRQRGASRENQPWLTLPVQAGQLVMFESWLRHEVPPNTAPGERISISFNYSWF
jgi:uncharacterized protein (TIGR02466 family)